MNTLPFSRYRVATSRLTDKHSEDNNSFLQLLDENAYKRQTKYLSTVKPSRLKTRVKPTVAPSCVSNIPHVMDMIQQNNRHTDVTARFFTHTATNSETEIK
jgi:hypothetical protein